jgi:hypothetical protein
MFYLITQDYFMIVTYLVSFLKNVCLIHVSVRFARCQQHKSVVCGKHTECMCNNMLKWGSVQIAIGRYPEEYAR